VSPVTVGDYEFALEAGIWFFTGIRH